MKVTTYTCDAVECGAAIPLDGCHHWVYEQESGLRAGHRALSVHVAELLTPAVERSIGGVNHCCSLDCLTVYVQTWGLQQAPKQLQSALPAAALGPWPSYALAMATVERVASQVRCGETAAGGGPCLLSYHHGGDCLDLTALGVIVGIEAGLEQH